MSTSLYPLFLNLKDRTCVVVGGTEMAEGKIRELLESGARIRVIAPEITRQISAWADSGKLKWIPRNYETGDLDDAFLVVAIADPATNASVFAEAEMQHTFCNAVDDIAHCNCYASAVLRRGPLQIAISTAGNSPALAQRLRKEFEKQFGEEYGAWVQQLGEARRRLFQDTTITVEMRREMLQAQATAVAFADFRDSQRPQGDRHNSVIIPEEPRKCS